MDNNHLVDTYNRLPVQFERGDGVWLYDTNGNRYLDAFCGIAVTGLGHNNPAITKVIAEQASKIIHVSNLVEIPEQIELSNLLIKIAGFNGKVFFNNSGAEAVETAIKLARLYGHSRGINNPKIAVMEGAFHGRTLATIFAGSNSKCQDGFGPAVQNFVRIPFNDAEAFATAVEADKEVVAVLVETIQGESGIRAPADDYINQLRKICDQNEVLLMLDEVQCGMARSGKFFCFQHNGIIPDVITMAKGLANGLPIGATIIREPYCDLFKPGSHGSTFGGNPLCCATAIATINELMNKACAENAAKQGQKILAGLHKALDANPHVKEIRGKGLLIGVQLDRQCREILPLALKHGIIFNVANLDTLRLLPPLIITDEQTQFIIDIIPKLIDEFYKSVN